MKIKVGDPKAAKAFVVCNGEMVSKAVEADDERGYVDYIATPICLIGWPARPLVHRIFGTVTIGYAV